MTSILLVEDQENLAAMEAELLRSHGYTVATASDAASALTAVATDMPDAIVLDLMLNQRMDGPTLLEVIRQDFGPTPPIIVLSGRITPDLAAELEQFVNVKALAKPAKVTDLVETIETLRGRIAGSSDGGEPTPRQE